ERQRVTNRSGTRFQSSAACNRVTISLIWFGGSTLRHSCSGHKLEDFCEDRGVWWSCRKDGYLPSAGAIARLLRLRPQPHQKNKVRKRVGLKVCIWIRDKSTRRLWSR